MLCLLTSLFTSSSILMRMLYFHFSAVRRSNEKQINRHRTVALYRTGEVSLFPSFYSKFEKSFFRFWILVCLKFEFQVPCEFLFSERSYRELINVRRRIPAVRSWRKVEDFGSISCLLLGVSSPIASLQSPQLDSRCYNLTEYAYGFYTQQLKTLIQHHYTRREQVCHQEIFLSLD